MEEITDGFQNMLRLTEKEKGGISVVDEESDGDDEGDTEIQNSLIGTLLTDRAYKSEFMKSTMVDAWRLSGKVDIKDVGMNLFIFTFDKNSDKNNVLLRSPWNFDNALLLLENPDKNINPRKMIFKEAEFWIQIHNLPLKFMKRSIIKKIGDSIGTVVKIDENESGVKWGAYVRVRVKVDIKKPLMRGSMIKVPEVGDVWIRYKYERLPKVCKWCGILGHSEGACSLKKEDVLGEYGNLRASNEIQRSKTYESKKQSSYTSKSNINEQKDESTRSSQKMTNIEGNNGIESGKFNLPGKSDNNTYSKGDSRNEVYKEINKTVGDEWSDTASSPIKITKVSGIRQKEKTATNVFLNLEKEALVVSNRMEGGLREDSDMGVSNNEEGSRIVVRSSWKRRAREGSNPSTLSNTKVCKRRGEWDDSRGGNYETVKKLKEDGKGNFFVEEKVDTEGERVLRDQKKAGESRSEGF